MAGETSAQTGLSSPSRVCPHFHAAVELVGKRWSGAILVTLTDAGPCRFGELNQGVPGLSDRLLSQRLRELEAVGLIERDVKAGSPVRVIYSLTVKGQDLDPALRELGDWGRRWKTGLDD